MPKGNSFPNSAFSYTVGDRYTTGDVYFLDSGATNASDGNDGRSPDKPLATLNGALDKVTANQGDIIFVMPGHTESSITTTTGIQVDVPGISIIGLGNGNLRPKFQIDGTSGRFLVDSGSGNLYMENLRVTASVSAVVRGMEINADNVEVRKFRFDYDSSGDDFLMTVRAHTNNDITIADCEFIAQDAAGAAQAIRLNAADNVRIENNNFFGDWSAAVIQNDSSVCENLLIKGNYITNTDSVASANAIDLNAASTGLIAYNSIGSDFTGDISGVIDPGACFCIENYVCNNIDETGIVVPTTASTS